MIDHKFFKEIPIFKMEIFVKFCQLQTLSKTGRAIGLTAADVNNIILGIEKNVGGPVYVRKVDKFTLTEKGEELLAFCTVILDAMENLDVKEINNKQKTLTIAASIWDSEYVLPSVLSKMSETYPDFTFKILIGANYVDLSNIECDVALGQYLQNRPELSQRFIIEGTVGLYATKEYLDKNGTPETLNQLKGHSLLAHTTFPLLPGGVYTNNKHLLLANTFTPLINFALEGKGILVIVDNVCRNDPRCATLVHVLPSFEIAKYSIFFLNRMNTENKNAIDYLFNLVQKKYHEHLS